MRGCGKTPATDETTIETPRLCDMAEVSRLFATSYADSHRFTPSYFDWRYNRCFGGRTKLVLTRKAGAIIGLAALFERQVIQRDAGYSTVQLADLLLHPEHRGLRQVTAIYKGISKALDQIAPDVVYTIPNNKSEILNRRFLGLKIQSRFSGWIGIGPVSNRIHQLANSGEWTPAALEARLSDPTAKYSIGGDAEWTAILRISHRLGMPYAILMASIPQDQLSNMKTAIAGRWHWTFLPRCIYQAEGPGSAKRPGFCYIKLPESVRGGRLLVEGKAMNPHGKKFCFNLLRPIDFDIF